jgi:hypothetical protein
MLPVSKTPGSVAVWAIVSLFNQFTVCPTVTVTGLGEYTPFAIVTVSRLGGFTHSGFVGVGVHGAVGLVVPDELPHPPPSRMKPTKATRVVGAAGRGRLNDIKHYSLSYGNQSKRHTVTAVDFSLVRSDRHRRNAAEFGHEFFDRVSARETSYSEGCTNLSQREIIVDDAASQGR